jgi:1,4-alpha-glucan branching enzyme
MSTIASCTRKDETTRPRRNPSRAAGDGRRTAQATRKRVTFRFQTSEHAQVYVAGTFNDWDPATHQLKPGAANGRLYRTRISLPRGTREYKFVVNGDWLADPECVDWVMNPFGSINSVAKV